MLRNFLNLNLNLKNLAVTAPPQAAKESVPNSNPPTEPKRRRKRGEDTFTSYYGRPIVKKPHWVWPVWVYFWTGGISSGASAIAALVEIFGDKKDVSIIRSAQYMSLASAAVSPVLLIIDLQRPERFLHMLRVFKLTSAISVGTYILTATGGLSGVNALHRLIEDGVIPEDSLPGKLGTLIPHSLTGAAQGVSGLGLGSYTGVLLSATAVPLWAKLHTVIPPLFLASAFSTGSAAIVIGQILQGVEDERLHRLDRVETSAILTELALLSYAAATLPPEIRKPALSGANKLYFGLAIGLGQILPLLLKAFVPKKAKAGQLFSLIHSLFVLVGGFFLRVAVVEAGKATADSADAYHATTRKPE